MDTTSSPAPTRGPHTPAARAAVRHNAVRHGLTARSIVIDGVETEAEWDEFQTDVVDSLAPENSLELAPANRIAQLLWRLRRVPRAERDLVATAQDREDAIETRRAKIDALDEEERRATAAALDAAAPRKRSFYASALVPLDVPSPPPDRRRLLPDEAPLQGIMRYEAHLNRQLVHTLHEFEALQARRVGIAAPLARVDVHVGAEE